MTTYDNLRSANVARQIEWDVSNGITGLYRAVELSGEAGEACNIVKKLERERLGLMGSTTTPEALAEELADVFICIDLLAAGYDLAGFFEHNRADFSTFPWEGLYAAGRLAGAAGFVADTVASNDDGVNPPKINLGLLDSKLREANMWAKFLAYKYDIEPKVALVAKFNSTSEKLGLVTRLHY